MQAHLNKTSFSATVLFIIIGFLNTFFLSQTPVTVVTGNVSPVSCSDVPCPLPRYYRYNRQQILLRTNELTAAGISGNAVLSKLNFYITYLCGSGNISYTIKMKCVTATSLTNSFDNTGLTQVFSGTINPNATGNFTITFSTPFTYVAGNSLLIDICTDSGAILNDNNQRTCRYKNNSGYNSWIFTQSDGSSLCNAGSTVFDPVQWLPELIVTSAPVNPTITTSAITGSPFCAGASVSVPYTISGTFTAGNVFTAQLSNSSGSFASGVTNIGTVTSTAAGTISATIPANAAAGNAYRIRVVSSTPAVTGTDNGTNLTIVSTAAPTAAIPQSFCGSATVANLAATGTSLKWYAASSGGSALATNTALSSTTYYVSQTLNGCESPRTAVSVTINALPDLPVYTAGNITVGPVAGVNGTPLLPDVNFSTSAGEYAGHETYRGRLFNVGSGTNGWAVNGTTYWQVDLGSVKPVNGIITQGRADCCPQWVTSYEVRISQDGSNWVSMGEFTGNSDQATPVKNMFVSQTTRARYVRIYPLTSSGHSTMRADVISIPAVCASGAQAVSMSAQPGSGANSIRWYAASSGGAALETSQYFTASIASTTTFYAASYNTVTGCESSTRKSVLAEVGVQVGSAPATAASLPYMGSDFSTATGTGFVTSSQVISNIATSTTHDCSGLAASLNNPIHYLWIKYDAAATNARYSIKVNQPNAAAIRYLLVEESSDGCNWTPVNIHTNTSIPTDMSINEFQVNLLSVSRHLRFNMTRANLSIGGKMEVDNVVIYNTTAPSPTGLASGTKSKTCKVYGQHWVHFYDNSNKWMGSVRANGNLTGTTNNLGDVTMITNEGAAGSMYACAYPSNELYRTAYMGRSWILTSTAFSGNDFTNAVDIRLPYMETELTAMNLIASGTTIGNPNDNAAVAGTLMLTKHSGPTENHTPIDNCVSGISRGIAQSSNGSLNSAFSTISSGTGSYVQFSVEQFSEMYLNKNFNVSPLPVQLTNLSAECEETNKVTVSWSTASETNSQKFTLEKSRDLNHWIYVKELTAAENSSIHTNYELVDENALGAVSYYRLIQHDFNGTENIFGPISVNCNNFNNTISIFPNPSNGSFTLQVLSSVVQADEKILISDLSGKIVYSSTVNLLEGTNQFLFNLDFPKGMYILQVGNQNGNKLKLIVN